MREISWDLRFYREKFDIIENCGSQNELILPTKRRPLKRIQARTKQPMAPGEREKRCKSRTEVSRFPTATNYRGKEGITTH
jgi:hypothetical protein